MSLRSKHDTHLLAITEFQKDYDKFTAEMVDEIIKDLDEEIESQAQIGEDLVQHRIEIDEMITQLSD